MALPDKLSFSSIMSTYAELRNERSEFEAEWRELSDYLLPGRGIYQTYSKPRKRKLTSPKVVNPIGEDSLFVLTAGMHGGLTSPTLPWFKLAWADPQLDSLEPLKLWLQQCGEILHKGFHASNFYSIINGFYTELAGFGTGSIYMGEDTYTAEVPFRFEALTVGEYAFSTGPDGKPDTFFRTIFMSPHQLVKRFPDAPKEMKDAVKKGNKSTHVVSLSVVECILKEPFMDKPYTQVYYAVNSNGASSSRSDNQKPLEVRGFYEFPYPTARWSTIGADDYGIGPGSRALPLIKRLQELEKSALVATHKNVDPPLNIPAIMKGKLNSLPGGRNYYSNPNQVVSELYNVRFDYVGVGMMIERIEDQIKRVFFNDIFLTGARDPNATPYKATEVIARDQEKMLRLGPTVERTQSEFLTLVIERGFNIMLRKGMFPELDPEFADMASDYNITLVSPMAVAQKEAAVQGITSFLGFVGQVAQYDSTALDNADIDQSVREYASLTGTKIGVLRPQDAVNKLRADRAKAEDEARKKQDAAIDANMQAELAGTNADTAKTMSETAVNAADSQQVLQDTGLF